MTRGKIANLTDKIVSLSEQIESADPNLDDDRMSSNLRNHRFGCLKVYVPYYPFCTTFFSIQSLFCNFTALLFSAEGALPIYLTVSISPALFRVNATLSR